MFPSKCKCGTLAFHSISHPLIQLAGEPAEEVANTRRFWEWTADAVFMGGRPKGCHSNRLQGRALCRRCHSWCIIRRPPIWYTFFHLIYLKWWLQSWWWSMVRNVRLLLSGLHSVPTAVCYWYDAQVGQHVFRSFSSLLVILNILIHLQPCQSPDQPSLLLLGYEKGGIHVIKFLNPSKGLFKNYPEKEHRQRRIFLPVSLVPSVDDPNSYSSLQE